MRTAFARRLVATTAFWVWVVVLFVIATSLGAGHLYALPKPTSSDAALSHAVNELRSDSEKNARLARISEQAQRIATRLGKAPVEGRIRDNGLHLEAARWASFWSSFIHVIRNAVDHGLEPKDERKSAGKPECGLIEISTAVQSNAFVVTISDDGRGIDWKRIGDRAKIKGIPHKSREDLTEAVFTDGISTAAYVSDLSGRGIGMAAVRAECHARGGTVQLHTTEGSGTRVVFSFPIASMADGRTASYAA